MISLLKIKLVFITVLVVTSFTRDPTPVIAKQTSKSPLPTTGTPDNPRTLGETQVSLPPAPDTGTPDGNRTAGGTRGTCKQKENTQTDKPLTALVPENAKGLTTSEHPVFWFYIPDVPEDVDSIEFSLHNQEEKITLYRTSIQLTQTPGIIGVSFPSDPEYVLELNKNYHWRFIVYCPQQEMSDDPAILLELDGWVTRVQQSPDLENQVIWYDELTNLARRYLDEPQNSEVKGAWLELLKSVGLEELAQAPLVGSISNEDIGNSTETRNDHYALLLNLGKLDSRVSQN
ncbi:MAG: DUF928 domain-containing protein [Coleofasciculaceae cyanobacterium]